MLLFSSHKLVFLAVPKAASTSVEAALLPLADTGLPKDKFPKHLTARMFFQRWQRFIADENEPPPEAFGILRHPIDRLGSWYRYRQRPSIPDPAKSTANLTFEDFVREYLSDAPKPFAQVGNPYHFCTDAQGKVLFRYLFSYENLGHLEAFILDRFGIPCELPQLNASTSARMELSGETLARLEDVNANEFELYEAVNANGWKAFPAR